MKQFSIYFVRLLSACCFCLILAKANTWLDTTNNTVLVFGYRSFILLAPLFLMITKKWVTFYSFLVSAIGMGLWFADQYLLGTILFSAGMAVGGYVLKYYAAKTPDGTANNRIAMNIGGVLSGLVIAFPSGGLYFLWLGLGMLVVTLFCIFLSERGSDIDAIVDHNQKTNFSLSQLNNFHGVSWGIVGVVTGVKIVSITSILPQYLIHYYGNLPNWYGWAIALNCMVVVFLQKPVMFVMAKLNLNQALCALMASMLVIAIPGVFHCQTMSGAMLWVFILTLIECAVSYLDVFSRQDGGLLIKEFFVGIGMALTVLIMRSMLPMMAAFFIGVVGFVAILIAMKLLRSEKEPIFNIKTKLELEVN
ncbi:MAG: hypothetical protein P4M12_02955 [Gammaproteobacteria bacterium]|nr:hypothetical protein [Gammaproteobacteria bacterium]